MMCNCKWTGLIASLVILVFTIWPTQIFSASVSWWLVVLAAAVMLLHSVFHHRCGCDMCSGDMGMPMAKKKRR